MFGLDDLKRILGSIDGTKKLIIKISREYLSLIWKAKPLQAKSARRAAFSRFKSMIYKLKTRLESLEDLRYQLRRLPIFDFENVRILMAGYPNVGKSSFVRAVTHARPEIAEYPFTTKNVTVGHYHGEGELKYLSCQVIDTPGLLDRQLTNRNDIELKALAALLNLPTLILFIFDPTQGVDHWKAQINLFYEINDQISIPIRVAINKIDMLDQENTQSLSLEIEEKFNRTPLLIETQNHEMTRKIMKQLLILSQ